MRGQCALGVPALMALTSLPNLRKVGDLRDWTGLQGPEGHTALQDLARRGWLHHVYHTTGHLEHG